VSQRLLLVDDDKGQLTLLREAIADWNAVNENERFEHEIAETYDAAVSALNKTRFDGALLDLRLPGGAGEFPGESLAQICFTEYGIPAGIISGNPAHFDKSKFNGMIEVFDKVDSDSYEKAVSWFGGLSHMMTILGGTRKKIQRLGASVFSLRVWPRWSEYAALKGIDSEQLTGIVSRQYASHIADILGIDSEENVKWHPFENYVVPALLEDRPHTGDIFKLDGGLWIVLTPQCDMATQKAATVLLAHCEPKPERTEWEKYVAFLQPGVSATKKAEAEKFFSRLVNQFEAAQHFLPPLGDSGPLIVEFKNLRTVPFADLKGMLSNRIASVATPFLGNLTQRFGAYISRMGQPNIDTTHFS
jgi:hypothetical protein